VTPCDVGTHYPVGDYANHAGVCSFKHHLVYISWLFVLPYDVIFRITLWNFCILKCIIMPDNDALYMNKHWSLKKTPLLDDCWRMKSHSSSRPDDLKIGLMT